MLTHLPAGAVDADDSQPGGYRYISSPTTNVGTARRFAKVPLTVTALGRQHGDGARR
jgi:hypothetical protein